jgi:hypothetical protein
MNKKLVISILAILVAATGLMGTLLFKNQRREPISIMSHASLAMMSLDDLITQADLIIIGRVNTVYPSRWNTPNGKLSKETTVETISPEMVIFTDTDFQIDKILKGKVEQPKVRVRTFGGEVEQDRMIIDAEPSLVGGQDYLLFLFNDTGLTADIDSEHFLVLGAIQGVYQIHDGKAVSVNDEWLLDDLIEYIRKALP